jgi:hypothetical protein
MTPDMHTLSSDTPDRVISKPRRVFPAKRARAPPSPPPRGFPPTPTKRKTTGGAPEAPPGPEGAPPTSGYPAELVRRPPRPPHPAGAGRALSRCLPESNRPSRPLTRPGAAAAGKSQVLAAPHAPSPGRCRPPRPPARPGPRPPDACLVQVQTGSHARLPGRGCQRASPGLPARGPFDAFPSPPRTGPPGRRSPSPHPSPYPAGFGGAGPRRAVPPRPSPGTDRPISDGRLGAGRRGPRPTAKGAGSGGGPRRPGAFSLPARQVAPPPVGHLRGGKWTGRREEESRLNKSS